MNNISFVFFGTPDRAVIALETLRNLGMMPKLIVTQPDRPQGRKFVITPPDVKVWGNKENVPVLQPEKLDDESFIEILKKGNFDVFIVVAYGKIIPDYILSIPKHGCLNLHGSLLPKLRGASPIETAILEDIKETGVTIIKMDSLLDHGPIIATKKAEIREWPIKTDELAKIIVEDGAKLVAQILPEWVKGTIETKEQDHNNASFTKKIKKEDGLIDLSTNSYKNLLKIKAYSTWPKAYFVDENKKRIIINDAHINNSMLVLDRITPEGKREMSWKEYCSGNKTTQ